MNRLDELLEQKNKQKELLKEETKVINEKSADLKELKEMLWTKMFEDIDSLDKYTNRQGYLDTGILCYGRENKEYKTIGFKLDKNEPDKLRVVSIEHNYHDGRKRPEPYVETFYGHIRRLEPFKNYNSNCSIDDKVERVLKNWDSCFEIIQDNLASYIELEIKKDKDKIIKTKEKLKQEVLDYTK